MANKWDLLMFLCSFFLSFLLLLLFITNVISEFESGSQYCTKAAVEWVTQITMKERMKSRRKKRICIVSYTRLAGAPATSRTRYRLLSLCGHEIIYVRGSKMWTRTQLAHIFFCPFLFPCIHEYIFVSRVARTRLNIVSKCFFPDLFSVLYLYCFIRRYVPFFLSILLLLLFHNSHFDDAIDESAL